MIAWTYIKEKRFARRFHDGLHKKIRKLDVQRIHRE